MSTTQRDELEANEVSFFASYYEGHEYNPTGWRLRLRRELGSLLSQARGNHLGRLLSVGCGDGQFELMIAPYAQHVEGLDISPEAIAVARRKAADEAVKNVEFRCQALSDLDWNETYDTIVCLAFLHHLPQDELLALVRQAHDHLVPGGLFYAEDPSVHGILRKLGRVILGRRYDDFHSPNERDLDPGEIADLLRQAGFSTVQVGYIDLTLIPALFILAKGPTWPLYVCAAVDWIWCRLPLRHLASGFTIVARK